MRARSNSRARCPQFLAPYRSRAAQLAHGFPKWRKGHRTAEATRRRGQLRTDQCLDLIPHICIAVDFGVRSHDVAVPPRVTRAVDRVVHVVEAEIPENAGSFRIHGAKGEAAYRNRLERCAVRSIT